MKSMIALAALLAASTAAQAGETYSFDIGGHSVRIERPRDCNDASCVSISIPGVYESGPKRGKRPRIEPDDADDDRPASQKPVQETRKPLNQPSSANDSAARQDALEPANGPPKVAPAPSTAPAATTTSRIQEPAPAPAASRASEPAASVANPAPQDSAPAKRSDPVIAAAPPSVPAQDQAAAATDKLSPLGVWLTEEKEGKVRIEQCGANLCGYSVNARSNENGEKILINMKPGGDNKWSGRIHDPKSGSNYDSTIALKGPDRLKVQGCAFGGMFCGGQTWSRVN